MYQIKTYSPHRNGNGNSALGSCDSFINKPSLIAPIGVATAVVSVRTWISRLDGTPGGKARSRIYEQKQ
jgi:hypothetical protein